MASKSKAKSAHEDTLEDLRQKHGDIASLVYDGTLFAFRRPTLEEYEDYQDGLGKRARGPCFREIAKTTCVHPADENFVALERLFEEQPVASARIADTLSDMAGAGIELTVKKG